MLILYIQAKSLNISPEEMQDFLGNAAPALHDPFTEKPFRWDAETKSIYFYRDKDSRNDLYYIPAAQ